MFCTSNGAIEPLFLKFLTMHTKFCGRKILLLREIVLCVPQPNAVLERFFSQLKYVKSNLRTSLLLQVLNTLLRIRVTGLSLQIFHEQNVKNAVNFWCNSKEQRIHQPKNRKTRAAQVAKPKRVNFDINELFSLSSSSRSSDSEDD